MIKEINVLIKEIITRTHNVKSFRLDVRDNIDFKAGQYLLVTLKTDNKELIKPLSISSSPTEKCYIEFTKKITNSEFSQILNTLKPGDSIKVKYPFGNFIIEEKPSKLAFLSGGIGITPIRSICKYITDKKLDINIILIYANGSIKDIIFGSDFEVMQKVNPRFKIAHVLCEPAEGFKCSVGLINSHTIKDEIPDYIERKFYLCGPPAMIEAMKKILLEELKISQQNIVTEKFVGY